MPEALSGACPTLCCLARPRAPRARLLYPGPVTRWNSLEIPGRQLRDLRVMLTMVDGKVVFERPAT